MPYYDWSLGTLVVWASPDTSAFSSPACLSDNAGFLKIRHPQIANLKLSPDECFSTPQDPVRSGQRGSASRSKPTSVTQTAECIPTFVCRRNRNDFPVIEGATEFAKSVALGLTGSLFLANFPTRQNKPLPHEISNPNEENRCLKNFQPNRRKPLPHEIFQPTKGNRSLKNSPASHSPIIKRTANSRAVVRMHAKPADPLSKHAKLISPLRHEIVALGKEYKSCKGHGDHLPEQVYSAL